LHPVRGAASGDAPQNQRSQCQSHRFITVFLSDFPAQEYLIYAKQGPPVARESLFSPYLQAEGGYSPADPETSVTTRLDCSVAAVFMMTVFTIFLVQGFQDCQLCRRQDSSELCPCLCSDDNQVGFNSGYLDCFRPDCRFVDGVCMNQFLKIFVLGTEARKNRLRNIFVRLEYPLCLSFLCIGQSKFCSDFPEIMVTMFTIMTALMVGTTTLLTAHFPDVCLCYAGECRYSRDTKHNYDFSRTLDIPHHSSVLLCIGLYHLVGKALSMRFGLQKIQL
jgi:hypothetical protein